MAGAKTQPGQERAELLDQFAAECQPTGTRGCVLDVDSFFWTDKALRYRRGDGLHLVWPDLGAGQVRKQHSDKDRVFSLLDADLVLCVVGSSMRIQPDPGSARWRTKRLAQSVGEFLSRRCWSLAAL